MLELPSICTEPLEDQERLYEAMEHLEKYRWLVFTSPTGVEVFFQEMAKREKDVQILCRLFTMEILSEKSLVK